MQQSTQNRGNQRALASELDDQPRLLASVLQAHIETCEFTREKVAAMRQRARDCPSYSMPTLVSTQRALRRGRSSRGNSSPYIQTHMQRAPFPRSTAFEPCWWCFFLGIDGWNSPRQRGDTHSQKTGARARSKGHSSLIIPLRGKHSLGSRFCHLI